MTAPAITPPGPRDWVDTLTTQAQQLLDAERAQLFGILSRHGDRPITSGPAFLALGAFVHDLDIGAARDAWRLTFGEHLRDVGLAGRMDLGKSVGSRFGITVSLARNLDDQADRMAGFVTQTTADRVVGAYRAIRDSAPTADDLRTALQDGLLSDDATSWRAGLIGCTAAKAAYNAGVHSAALGSGTVQSKTWNHDGAPIEPRDWHIDMDGETVSVGEVFSNGLQYPGDPDGDPSETINCTCSVSYNLEPADALDAVT